MTFEQIEDLVVSACRDPKHAGFQLAMHYLNPEDEAEQDVFRAIHWLAYSAKAGNGEAREFFDCLYGSGFCVGAVEKGFWFEREIEEHRIIRPTEPYALRSIVAKCRRNCGVRRVTQMASYSADGTMLREGVVEERRPEFFTQLSRECLGDYFWYFPRADWICMKSPVIEQLFRDRYIDGMPGAQVVQVYHKRIVCYNLADVLNEVRILRPNLVAKKVFRSVCIEPPEVRVIDEKAGKLSYRPAHFAKYDDGDESGCLPVAVFETSFDGVTFQRRTLGGGWKIVDHGPYDASKSCYESEAAALCEEIDDLAPVDNKLCLRDGMSVEEELDLIRKALDDTNFEWFHSVSEGVRWRADCRLMGWKCGMDKPETEELVSADKMARILLAKAEDIDRNAELSEDGLIASSEIESLWEQTDDE